MSLLNSSYGSSFRGGGGVCRSGGRGAAVGGEQGGEHLESRARTSRSRNVTLKQFLRVFVSRGGGVCRSGGRGAAVGGEQGGEHLESRARTSRSRNVTLKQFLRVFVSRGGGVCCSGGWGAAVGGEQGGEHLESRARTSRSRNVTLKQFLRVFVSRGGGGECVAMVDRGMPWEVNKQESIWSLVPGHHVHVMSLLNSSYGSSFRRGRGRAWRSGGRGAAVGGEQGGEHLESRTWPPRSRNVTLKQFLRSPFRGVWSVSQWWTGGCRGRWTRRRASGVSCPDVTFT